MQAIHGGSGAAQSGQHRMAGQSPQSVGHRAKAAVSVARDTGQVLPANAQGLAASVIARGTDPAALFAALVAAPGSDGDTGMDGTGDSAADPGAPDAIVEPVTDAATWEGDGTPDGGAALVAAATAGYADAGDFVGGGDVALDLLRSA